MKKRRRRIYLTDAEKAVMWDRWKQIDPMFPESAIQNAFKKLVRANQVINKQLQ